MRIQRLVLLSVIALSIGAFSQAIPAYDVRALPITPSKDAEGVAFLQRVLNRLGDPGGLLSRQSCAIDSENANASQDSARTEWIIEGKDYAQKVTTGEKEREFSSYSPFMVNGRPYKQTDASLHAHFIPAAATQMLAQSLGDPEVSVGRQTYQVIKGKSLVVLRVSNVTDRTLQRESDQFWYFDSETLYPVRVEYSLVSPQGSGKSLPLVTIFESFQSFQNLFFPKSFYTLVGTKKISSVLVKSVKCDVSYRGSQFFQAHSGVSK